MQTIGYVCFFFSGERIHNFQNILKLVLNFKSLWEREEQEFRGLKEASHQWAKFHQMVRLSRADRILLIL